MSWRDGLRKGRSHLLSAFVLAAGGLLVVNIEDDTLEQETGGTPRSGSSPAISTVAPSTPTPPAPLPSVSQLASRAARELPIKSALMFRSAPTKARPAQRARGGRFCANWVTRPTLACGLNRSARSIACNWGHWRCQMQRRFASDWSARNGIASWCGGIKKLLQRQAVDARIAMIVDHVDTGLDDLDTAPAFCLQRKGATHRHLPILHRNAKVGQVQFHDTMPLAYR